MRQLSSTLAAGAAILGSLVLGGHMSPASAQGAKGTPAGEGPIKAVLELYTSQGCSSCPPADALMEKYTARKDVLALSFPVDYWDYLGWKDTLANPKFSDRQRQYARQRGDGRVYTPQMVVSGRTHTIGSSDQAIESAIASTATELAHERIPVKVRADKDHLFIETGNAPEGSKLAEATIWLVMVQRVVEVKIAKGENRGKTVKYYNVVREMSPVGMWAGKPNTLTLPRAAIASPDNTLCAVLLQVGNTGPIVGAAAYSGL